MRAVVLLCALASACGSVECRQVCLEREQELLTVFNIIAPCTDEVFEYADACPECRALMRELYGVETTSGTCAPP